MDVRSEGLVLDVHVTTGPDSRVISLYEDDLFGTAKIADVLRTDWDEPSWFAERIAKEVGDGDWWTVWMVMTS